LIGAGKRLVKNPLLLLPALASMVIFFALGFVFLPFAADLMLDVLFLEIIPDSSLLAFPFQFFALYPLQILALGLFALLSGLLFTALNYWYANYLGESLGKSASIGKACRETLGALKAIASLVLFIAIISLVFGTLFWVSAVISIAIPLLGLGLMLVLSLAGFYVYIKIAFATQALALEEGSVKQALQQTWDFSQKRFWHVILFLIVLGLIHQIIVFLGDYVSLLFLDETIEIIVFAVFWGASLAFAGLAMALYYAEKALSKGI